MSFLRKKLFAICIIFFAVELNAQPYFQQHVAYKISVSLNDSKNELNGFETLTYTNNSPGSLTEIYFHLYPNAYKDNNTALAKEFLKHGDLSFQNAHDSLRGFIDGLDFKVNNTAAKFEQDANNIDIGKLILNEPLQTGQSVVITTPFYVKIPDARFSRLGHTGQAYYISQWYPKPAVFDRTGWHFMPYLTQGEFYGEFGSYEVQITLPQNYVVGATGNLQEQSEINFLNYKYEQTRNIKVFEKDLSFPASSSQTKTITYKIDSVHDFAWFADKRFHVFKSQVELPHTKRKVTTYAMFTNSEAVLWKNASEYINNALYFYSKWNGDYPYDVCTAVDGIIAAGGGMEYPTITVIGKSYIPYIFENVIVHEVGHNWFYGILGTNERQFAWMDEGINSFYEQRYFYSNKNAEKGNTLAFAVPFSSLTGVKDYNPKEATMAEAMLSVGYYINQSLSTPAKDFTTLNYGLNTYAYSAVLFEYLKCALGDSVFDLCMSQYFNEWKYKHPYPEDLQKVFETLTGQDFNWFFNDLIKTTKRIDYAITNVEFTGKFSFDTDRKKIYSVEIENRNEAIAPFNVSTIGENRIMETKWIYGFEGKKKIEIACNNCDYITLSATGEVPDINNRNNSMRINGAFKKFEPLRIQFLPRVGEANKSQLFFTPALGFNIHNGLMAGISFSNFFTLKKNFEFSITPLYGFESNSIAGVADFNYTRFFNTGWLHHILFNVNPRYFAYLTDDIKHTDGIVREDIFNYATIPFSVKLFQRKKSEAHQTQNIFEVKNIWNALEQYSYIKSNPGNEVKFRNTFQVSASQVNRNKLDPYSLSLITESGDKYGKAFFEIEKSFSYSRVKRGIKLRLFGGAFLFNESTGYSSFKMSGWSGNNDYLLYDYYFARNDADNFLSQQMSIHDGGFKAYSPGAQSNKWLLAVNAEIKIPFLPIKLFADAGTYHKAKTAYEGSEALVYDAGVAISLIKNVCEVYLPFIYSSDIKKYHTANDLKFGDKIRFTFNIKSLNLLNLRQQLQDAY